MYVFNVICLHTASLLFVIAFTVVIGQWDRGLERLLSGMTEYFVFVNSEYILQLKKNWDLKWYDPRLLI